jgi:hypothetical protein
MPRDVDSPEPVDGGMDSPAGGPLLGAATHVHHVWRDSAGFRFMVRFPQGQPRVGTVGRSVGVAAGKGLSPVLPGACRPSPSDVPMLELRAAMRLGDVSLRPVCKYDLTDSPHDPGDNSIGFPAGKPLRECPRSQPARRPTCTETRCLKEEQSSKRHGRVVIERWLCLV